MKIKPNTNTNTNTNTYPYIAVEGMENHYVDAALLHSLLVKNIILSLKKYRYIAKKAGITVIELNQRQFVKKELILRISPYLSESHDFYSSAVDYWQGVAPKRIYQFIRTYKKSVRTVEDWGKLAEWLINEKEVNLYMVVNLLRYHNNGELHSLIKPLLEKYAETYHLETNIRLGEEFGTIEAEGLGEGTGMELLLQEQMEEELDQVIQILESMKARARAKGNTGQYVDQSIAPDREKIDELSQERDNLKQEIKSKDAQVVSLQRQNRELETKNQGLESELKTDRSKLGQTSQLLGESRKKLEQLTAEKDTLALKAFRVEKEKEKVAGIVRKQAEEEFNKQLALLRKELSSAQQTVVEKQATIDGHLEKEVALQAELTAKKLEIEQLQKRLNRREQDQQVVSESNENDSANDSFDISDFSLDSFIDFKPDKH